MKRGSPGAALESRAAWCPSGNRCLCKGCGPCVAACPAGAITVGQFTDKQILAAIEGLLADAKLPLVAV